MPRLLAKAMCIFTLYLIKYSLRLRNERFNLKQLNSTSYEFKHFRIRNIKKVFLLKICLIEIFQFDNIYIDKELLQRYTVIKILLPTKLFKNAY